MRLAFIPLLLLVAACAPKHIVVEKPVITYVEKPIECPSAEERERLRQLRPAPLREQSMPADVVERLGKLLAQLGIYEAQGGYADQVEAALDRCQKP